MSVKNNINVNMSVSGLLKSALDSQMFVSLSKKLASKLRKGEISVSNCYTNNASQRQAKYKAFRLQGILYL